jgi:predicted ATP-dependent protease
MPDQSDPKGEERERALLPAPSHPELSASDLRYGCALEPDELVRIAAQGDSGELLGQARAFDAIRLALGVVAPGYNVYVSGLRTREGRGSILRLLQEKAASMPTPGDWVYVNNFHSPEAPVAIYLAPGQGIELRNRMRELIAFVLDQLPKAFRREDFDQERATLREKYNKRAQELFGGFETRARERGFAVRGTPNGQLLFVPLIKGKPPESPEELQREMQAMSEAEREKLAAAQNELQGELATVMMRQQEITRELIEDIRAIERAFAAHMITPAITSLKQFFNNDPVAKYLDEIADHILNHLERFREPAGEPGAEGEAAAPIQHRPETTRFAEYQVNVLVDNSGLKGAPVISEDAPTYRNLFGTIERVVDPLGRATTDFSRITAGSFVKAHGGFLLFDLEDAAAEPGVWKSLKRSLKTGRMTLETLEPIPFLFGSGLKPEAIDVNNKVVVLGGAYLYNLLYFYDPEFAELFKVKAEIRPVVDAEEAATRHYAGRIGAVVRREKLLPFDGIALCRMVEYGMRLAGDRDRVASAMEPIDDLAREAVFFARTEGAQLVTPQHVDRALHERILRLNYIEEEIRRLIANGTIIVHLDGRAVGQINGLAVLDVGGYAFGRPSRVTTTVAVGQAGLINIEREAHLSGATHDKGVMILSGFLRNRFGQDRPLALSASICFEQSYSGIDGDSASSTELYALLSALSGVPIRQDLAVTGSVDQFGTVQAIGGANEKIEGFFRVCKAVGLTGRQGVLVPRANLRNLMLDLEVVGAVERGEFHIYPVDDIGHGIELLTGCRAGAPTEPGTIFHRVAEHLQAMGEKLRAMGPTETRVIHESQSAPPAPAPPAPPQPPR